MIYARRKIPFLWELLQNKPRRMLAIFFNLRVNRDILMEFSCKKLYFYILNECFRNGKYYTVRITLYFNVFFPSSSHLNLIRPRENWYTKIKNEKIKKVNVRQHKLQTRVQDHRQT